MAEKHIFFFRSDRARSGSFGSYRVRDPTIPFSDGDFGVPKSIGPKNNTFTFPPAESTEGLPRGRVGGVSPGGVGVRDGEAPRVSEKGDDSVKGKDLLKRFEIL